MRTLAVLLPVDVASIVTLIEHAEAPTGIVAGQVLTSANWLAFVPVSDTPVIVRSAVPVLETVTTRGALTTPTFWLPKAIDVGPTLISGRPGSVTVPASCTVTGDRRPSWPITTVADFGPTGVAGDGASATSIVHVSSRSSVVAAPHVPPVMENAAWSAPPSAGVTVSAGWSRLATVIVRTAEVVPCGCGPKVRLPVSVTIGPASLPDTVNWSLRARVSPASVWISR